MTVLQRNDRTCREPAATREDVVVKAVHYSAIPYTWCGFVQEGFRQVGYKLKLNNPPAFS